MPIKNEFRAPRFRSFHAIAALRGDGLHPELLKLFERLAKGADTNLSQSVEASEGCGFPNRLRLEQHRGRSEALKKA
jgi:hypothetical protein